MRLFRFFKKKKCTLSKIEILRNKGAIIGEKTRIYCEVSSFGTEPYLITIGDDCLITSGVRFITHDGGVKVLNTLGYFNGQRMDRIAPIVLGNNVYIGIGAVIMPGVTIGNNVVIGANAVVTHNIPDNVVAAGVPAVIIKSIDDYYRTGISKGWYYPTAGMPIEEKRSYYEQKFKKET